MRNANFQLLLGMSQTFVPRKSERENKGKGVDRYGFAKVAYQPQTYNQAVDCLDADKWIYAMHEEHLRMIDLNVWDVVEGKDLPSGRKCINAGWVYTIKLNANGSIERFKARLVAKGYAQIAGIDYNETFAPVTKYDSLCFVIALATNLNLHLEHLDIKTAFLYDNLNNEIWMNPPPGIGLNGKVLCLQKPIYGL